MHSSNLIIIHSAIMIYAVSFSVSLYLSILQKPRISQLCLIHNVIHDWWEIRGKNICMCATFTLCTLTRNVHFISLLTSFGKKSAMINCHFLWTVESFWILRMRLLHFFLLNWIEFNVITQFIQFEQWRLPQLRQMKLNECHFTLQEIWFL